MTNDQILLERWNRNRDADAFQEIVSCYAGMVYGICKRILRDPVDAQDAAQECFESLVQAGSRPGPYLGPWLHRVATNQGLKHLRAERRRKEREWRFSAGTASQDGDPCDDTYALIDQAIAELPEKFRVPLVEHFLQGRTHDDIAQNLQLSRQAVSYRITKAVERIRRSLRRQGVPLATTALAGLLEASLSEAAPQALITELGKLAVMGPLQMTAVTPLARAAAWLKGMPAGAKMASLAACVLVAAGTTYRVFPDRRPEELPNGTVQTMVPAPETPTQTPSRPERGASPAGVKAVSAVAPETPAAPVPTTSPPAHTEILTKPTDVQITGAVVYQDDTPATDGAASVKLVDTHGDECWIGTDEQAGFLFRAAQGIYTLTAFDNRQTQSEPVTVQAPARNVILVLPVLAPERPPYPAPNDAIHTQRKNAMLQAGLAFRRSATEGKSGRFPGLAAQSRALCPDVSALVPEYLPDRTVASNLTGSQGINTCYFGYAVDNEACAQAFLDAYEAVGVEGLNDRDIRLDRDAALSLNTDCIWRLREGIERFLITDINDPAQPATIQASLPVLWELPTRTEGGGWVLYFDGHIEWRPYPGDFPMTEPLAERISGIIAAPQAATR